MDFAVTMGKAEEERDILNTSGPNLGTSSSYLVPLILEMDPPRGFTLHIKVWGVADYVILLSTLYDIIFWFYLCSLGQWGTRNLHNFESIILVAEFPVSVSGIFQKSV